MKINIIFPYNNIGGAFRSTYELSNNLIRLGHDVKIYTPFFPYLEGKTLFSKDGIKILFRGIARSLVRWNRVSWFDLKAQYQIVPLIRNAFIRDADIVVANHWPTVSDVFNLKASKGIKFNFIRDTNPWMENQDLEIESFKKKVYRIVVSPWLKEHLENDLGLRVEGVIPNGTNLDDFLINREGYNYPPSLGMAYYDHPQKGMEDGLEVLKTIKKNNPDVKIILFGLSRPKKLPFDVAFHLKPTKKELRDLYGACDIFLFPSIQEGSGNPPREAMVSGCALVTTNVGCIPQCTLPGKTAIVVDPRDKNSMIEHIQDLIEYPNKISELGSAAQDYIKQFTWEKSSLQLEKIFADKLEEQKLKRKL